MVTATLKTSAKPKIKLKDTGTNLKVTAATTKIIHLTNADGGFF